MDFDPPFVLDVRPFLFELLHHVPPDKEPLFVLLFDLLLSESPLSEIPEFPLDDGGLGHQKL